MTSGHVAVIDIGKTNAKLALVDFATLMEVAVLTRPNQVLSGPPWPHFDTAENWEFILDGLAQFQSIHSIDAISVTTHGACAALIGKDGTLAAPILDYEHDGPEDTARAYDAIRPAFSETGAPRLGIGLNIGAQLFWQFQRDPELLARTQHIVTYPQYWGFRLTGIAATDVSSLGCHTDLWNPHAGTFSSLVDRLGIAGKIAPARASGDVLGPILPDIAQRTGIALDTPVVCGIHDSNASLLPHLLQRKPPFSVVSTGTWVIAMAIGGCDVALDPLRDTLINVDAYGQPVPSARFMGGREHDLILGADFAVPTDQDIADVLGQKVMLLPAVEALSGPFQGVKSRWVGQEPDLGTGRRTAAVGFYLALVTARCLKLIGHSGPIIVEGPFARNHCFRQMLASTCATEVFAAEGATGTSQGAALLVAKDLRLGNLANADAPATGDRAQELRGYAKQWRSHLAT